MERTRGTKVIVGVALFIGAAALQTPLSNCRAQEVAATVIGTVRDTTGAVVPNAKVTVTSVATNVRRTATTDGFGNYSVAALNPGEYTLSAEYQGFKTEIIRGIVLQVNQTARLDIAMQPGQLLQTVEVTGAAPVVNTENPEIGSVVDQNRIVEIPLNGRNFMELTTLTAGINEAEISNQSTYATGGFAPSAAGQPAVENNYTLDGADNKSAYFNIFSVAPSVDAVQEFRVQIGQYSAEFGSGGGAVINVVTKSGSNTLHGTAFEFFRNQVLDARNFFQADRAPLRRNQFGASVGGPIKKDKAFFFGNYDGTRYRAPGTTAAIVPTDAEKNGDLSAFGKTLTDPLTGTPFTGGMIPAGQISPISKGILSYYPEPNTSVTSISSPNFVRSFSNQNDQDSYLARVDYTLSEKHALTGRYAYQKLTNAYPGMFPGVGGTNNPALYQNAALGLTSNLTPHLINEFRFGFNRWNNFTAGQNAGKPIAQQLGLQFHASSPQDYGFPENTSYSNSTISGIGESYPFLILTNTFQWYDGLAWTHGSHTIKAGANVMRNRSITDCAVHGNGVYSFSGQYSGDGFADFLLGYPNTIVATLSPSARIHAFQTKQSYYVLDDWKESPKLTLNLGLRYEYEQYPWDKEGDSSIFDPTLGGGAGGLRYPKQNTLAQSFYTQQRPDLPFGFFDRKSAKIPLKTLFAPRFGFAYRPFANTKTVVRGGYGWFYSSPENLNFEGNFAFSPPAYVTPTFFGNPTVPNLTWNGIPGVPATGFIRSLTFGALDGPETHFHDEYTQQWSLSLGREVARDTSIEVQYLGSKSTHVRTGEDYNWTPPSLLPLTSRLPYPKWGRLLGYYDGANANYNALLISAERRLGKGLTFHAAYTYAQALTVGGGRQYYGDGSYIQNPGGLSAEKGPIADDVKHRFVLSYVYDLPFGRNTTGIAGKVIGGWKVSGITTLRTGFALLGPLVSSVNCNSSNCNSCRPDLIGQPRLGGNGVNTPRFDVNAFDWPFKTDAKGNYIHNPQIPHFGNAQPELLRGNSLDMWNLALLKHSKFRERYDWEFRFEMFNFPNHANFGDPNTSVDSGILGRTYSAAAGRDLQFGLKLYW